MKIFDRPGPANTSNTLEIARQLSPNFNHVVVASITGQSALQAAQSIDPHKLICVTCPQGMCWESDKMQKGPFADIPELVAIRDQWTRQGLARIPMNVTPENRSSLNRLGIPIVQGAIPLFGPTFSLRLHLQKTTDLDIIAKTLEMFSTGTLVCLETVLMCVDAGVIPETEPVIALAGTERGLDTAWIIRPCASHNLFHPTLGARFVELLAKPAIAMIPDLKIEYLR